MNKRKNIIPNNLKEHRLKAGFTQHQVAKSLGFETQERICHWEKGCNIPNLLNIVKPMKLYNATLSDLYPNL